MFLKTIAGITLSLFILTGCQQKPKDQQKESDLQEEQKSPTEGQKSEEISDKELQQFATIQQQANTISQQSHQDKVSAVEDIGLEVERFNEIEQAQQDPNIQMDATKEELQMYQEAIQFLEEIQGRDQQKMVELIEDKGLSVTRYQEIEYAIQSDPELQLKYQTMMQDTDN
ncbi:MAG: DUF4168 domain-containing protein [Bacteroidales bacterium]